MLRSATMSSKYLLDNVIDRIALSHENCQNYFFKSNYRYISSYCGDVLNLSLVKQLLSPPPTSQLLVSPTSINTKVMKGGVYGKI